MEKPLSEHYFVYSDDRGIIYILPDEISKPVYQLHVDLNDNGYEIIKNGGKKYPSSLLGHHYLTKGVYTGDIVWFLGLPSFCALF